MVEFSLIAAVDSENGIGKNNALPWHIPEDLRYFELMSTGTYKTGENVVIMGRLTWESIPKNYRPLKNRVNIVISSKEIDDCEYICSTLDESLDLVKQLDFINDIFIVGGEMLYREAINRDECKRLFITRLNKKFNCDRFFPEIDEKVYHVINKSIDYIKEDIKYNFIEYKRL